VQTAAAQFALQAMQRVKIRMRSPRPLRETRTSRRPGPRLPAPGSRNLN
jgi:hypothetical protein